MGKFNYKKAKEDGYSDKEILDFLGEKHPKFDLRGAEKSGYSSPEIIQFLSESQRDNRSGAEKSARLGAQYGLGLADRALAPLAISSSVLGSEKAQHAELRKHVFEDLERLAEKKQTGDWDEQDEQLFQYLQDQIKHPEKLKEHVKTVDISPSGLLESSAKGLGYDVSPEGGLEHVSRFLGGLTPKEWFNAAKSLGGLAKKSFPSSRKPSNLNINKTSAASTELTPTLREAERGAAREMEVLGKETSTFPSGLTKSVAVEHPLAEKAIISPTRQEKALKSIDQEASKLTKTSIEKHLPQAKKIEEGFDFQGKFDKGFSKIRKAAKKYNVDADVTDIYEYLNKSRKVIGNLPKGLLPPEQQKILKDIKLLRNRPQTKLNDLITLFRANNKKRSAIWETRLATGKQKEYVDFLTGLNKSIVKSLERTFPEESPFVSFFKKLNSEYSAFANAERMLGLLEPVLGGRASAALINKLAVNPAMHRKLTSAMGKEGAQDIIQIAKDIRTARESIKNIPVKAVREMDIIYPLGLIIPGAKITAAIGLTKKVVEYGRRALGWYLTTPQRTNNFHKAVNAASQGNVVEYKKATDALISDL